MSKSNKKQQKALGIACGFIGWDIVWLWFWFLMNHLTVKFEWPLWTIVPMNITLGLIMAISLVISVGAICNFFDECNK